LGNKIKEAFEDPRKVISKALVALGGRNKDVIFISCDSSLGASGEPFRQRYPQRHFEFGIQEQSSMGTAAGFAASGKIPFITAYVPFITFRCFEQIRDDVCKTNLNVNIIGNNCGFSVSALGPTHVVLEDVSAMRSIPNITIISPADGPEYRQTIFAAAEIEGPVYLRVHRHKIRSIHKNGFKFIPGKGELLRRGSDITLITTSTMVVNSLNAATLLQSYGISVEVINMSTLKPIDEDIIIKSTSKTKRVVTVEEHSIIGGLGSAVSDVLIRENPVKMEMIGIEDKFAIVGNYKQVIDYYGLTSEKIASSIINFINKNKECNL